jgi:SAM-dependent methyltransferase
VGFGKERRSALALRAIFGQSATQLVAIDNDLNLFAKDSEAFSSSESRVRYLFSDVDLLDIPGERKYDLVVFCMSLFCLQNPLRAIGTIASRALKKNGRLLITQRNDPVLRALCGLDKPGSKPNSDADSVTVGFIHDFWQQIEDTARDKKIDLRFPWRFRLICEHEPLFGFLKDIGFEDVTATGYGKRSGEYEVFDDPAHAETFGSVLGGQDESREPQYSKMKWAWHQFSDKALWPEIGDRKDDPLRLTHITLSSRVFRLTTDEVAVSNHPFSTYTAPLKIVPTVWSRDEMSEDELERKARERVEEWIRNRTSAKTIRAFFLLSPHGVSGCEGNLKPLALYDDGVLPLGSEESSDMDELALSSFLENNKSDSVVIQFYRLNSKVFWPEAAASSIFLNQAASPVKMLVFPVYVSGNDDDDIKEIRLHVKELEKVVDTTGVLDTDFEITSVARYLLARGKWMKKNNAFGIYYYYRQNPSADNRPVARGASILVTEALPIETTIEFLVMADEVIGNYQSQRYVNALRQRVIFGEKAGKAGILVRNLSHHIGSHVLVNRQASAQKVWEGQTIDYERAANELSADSMFYTYIRERMEFLAMLSLDAQLWSMPVRVEDLFAFLGDEAESAILRDNIGANEKVTFAEVSAPADVADEIIALPWGTTGLHAFYTFVEGLLRNACKHGGITAPIAHLEVQVEKPKGDVGCLWLYCGVPEQTVSANDAARAILKRITPDKDISDNPIEELNGFLGKPLQVTRPEGGYAHGALGIMEMAIAANFLSCGEAGLRVKDCAGKLFMGFKLTRPKGMCNVPPQSSFDNFSYDYDSYLVECETVVSQGSVLPQFPLGPRTLYVANSKCDDGYIHRYACISRVEWDNSRQDEEFVAGQLLRIRHNAEDFRVVIVGKSPWLDEWKWDKSGAERSRVDFYIYDPITDREQLKALVANGCADESRTLILAHGTNETIMEDERRKQHDGGHNVAVFRISDGDEICRQYVAACVRQGKWNALRLLLWEAAFLKYEIYDNRILGQFHEEYGETRENGHIALLNEKSICNLAGATYTKDVVRIIHVSPWNEQQKKFDNLAWEPLYPNIVFHTARGGDVIASGQWDFPRLDYSSVVRALESGRAGNKMDSLVRLALLTQRVGCSPSKHS